MKTFKRANLPKEIKYNGKTYVCDFTLSGQLGMGLSKYQLPLNSVIVEVLPNCLKGKLDVFNKPYTPSQFVFRLSNVPCGTN